MKSKNILFIFFLISLLSGIFVVNLFFSVIPSLIIWIIFILFLINYLQYIPENKSICIAILLGFWIWVAYWWFGVSNIDTTADLLSSTTNDFTKIVSTEWVINSVYKQWGEKSQYIFRVEKIDQTDINRNLLLILKTHPFNKLKNGQRIIVRTKINEITNSLGVFNLRSYYRSKWIFGSLEAFSIKHIEYIPKVGVMKYIDQVRGKLKGIIYEIYPKDAAVFLWWLLLWARESMNRELSENFNRSWLTHIIAVSWYNITIIVVFISFLFKYFPLPIRTIATTVFVILFVLLVGPSAAVLRAWIMWMLWYYVLISWRRSSLITVVLFTLTLMTLYSPLMLTYDISMHLSFLAVIWIMYFREFYQKIFFFLPDFLAINESFVLTFSALTLTFPIMVVNFWQISIVSPLTNFLVTWFLPITMLFGFISILLFLVTPLAWVAAGFVTWIFLKYILIVVNYFWSQTFSVLTIEAWYNWVFLEAIFFMMVTYLLLKKWIINIPKDNTIIT